MLWYKTYADLGYFVPSEFPFAPIKVWSDCLTALGMEAKKGWLPG